MTEGREREGRVDQEGGWSERGGSANQNHCITDCFEYFYALPIVVYEEICGNGV